MSLKPLVEVKRPQKPSCELEVIRKGLQGAHGKKKDEQVAPVPSPARSGVHDLCKAPAGLP